MKALVTGGAGFIGSNLVDELISKGFQVTVLDNEFSDVHDQFYWNEKASNYKLDCRDYDNTRLLYENIDYVFHLAAEARIQPAILNPIEAVSINSLGTCTVLQCASEAKVKRVIFSSTSSIYGKNIAPNSENQNPDCMNPYSISKYSGEMLCNVYYSLFNLETIVLRYFNVFGERQPLKGKYAPLIGIFLRQKHNNQPLTVVGDGEQRRDFTYVGDVVSANILAATTNLDKKYFGTVFNVGSGSNYSVNEIAAMISKNISKIDSRPGESRETLADISKIRTELKWEPKTKLENWIIQNL
jgi:UDP-glucose 4-epimerase